MNKNWTISLALRQAQRYLIAIIVVCLMGSTFQVSAYDDYDDYDDDYDDYDDYGDDYDLDMGDTVIIDDSVNVYNGGGGRGGRGRGSRSGGGDSTGAAILGFMGGMVVNEMMQDKRKPAPQAREPARASGQSAPTLEQQLAELDSLKSRGILTEAEYNAKRQSVINSH